MKKIIKLIIFMIIIYTVPVLADSCDEYACATCTYEDELIRVTYDIKSEDDGSLSLNFSQENIDTNNTWKYNFTQTLIAQHFVNQYKKISCPEIYLRIINTDEDSKVQDFELSFIETPSGSSLLKLKETINNAKEIGESSNNKVCVYDKVNAVNNRTTKTKFFSLTIKYIGNSQIYIFSKDMEGTQYSLRSSSLTDEDFLGEKCPKIKVNCGDQYHEESNECDVEAYDNGIPGGNLWKKNVKDKDTFDNLLTGTTSCSTLGLLRKDLKGFFTIFKIIAPILVVVLSVYDFIKTFVGNVEGEAKKAFIRFIKRIVFALILFFLPTLLDFFLGIVDPNFSTCINS